jgi:hypothetical protein
VKNTARSATSTTLNGVVLGFDPGGSSRIGNGVAAVQLVNGAVQELATDHFQNVDQASEWILAQVQAAPPLALAIDTLLAWSGATNGDRAVDRSLRAQYHAVGSSVVSPNGLYGAMSIGGPLLAARLRGQYPVLPLFETHPKVLYYAQTGQVANWEENAVAMNLWLAGELGLEGLQTDTEDEFDAALSALVGVRRLRQEWIFNLYTLSDHANEQLAFPTPGPVAQYPWSAEVPGV